MAHPKPDFSVSLDGNDLTSVIDPRLESLTISECRAEEADTLNLVIVDHDGKIALPKRGAVLRVAIGWAGAGLIDKGQFTVDEVEYSGAPDVISIHARSASMTRDMGARRERSWHGQTIGQIVRTIAGEHKLSPVVGDKLGATAIPHIDQTHESNMSFLTRMAKRYDAVMTVKDGRLLFMPIGEAKTSSGKDMPIIRIERKSGDRHRFHVSERENYKGVRAYWHSGKNGKRKSVIAGGEDNHNMKVLPEIYSSEGEALDAAKAEFQRCQRGQATMCYTLALGRAEIIPEAPAEVSGFKPDIDDNDWLVKRVTHTIDQGGFITSLELETRDDPTSKRHSSNFRRT